MRLCLHLLRLGLWLRVSAVSAGGHTASETAPAITNLYKEDQQRHQASHGIKGCLTEMESRKHLPLCLWHQLLLCGRLEGWLQGDKALQGKDKLLVG